MASGSGESGPQNRKDFAWEYAREDEGNTSRGYMYCVFCNKKCTGGISRLKNHLAGTHHGMSPCLKVPEDVKKRCETALNNLKTQKKKDAELVCTIGRVGSSVRSSSVSVVGPEREIVGGPMDQFVDTQARQTTLNKPWKQAQRKDVCKAIGRCFFGNALPFNLVNSPYFKAMCDSIANFGPGFKPPSMHEMRTWVLKEEVENINDLMAEYKKSWSKYGCTIMSDGWTDGKNRALINFLINSPAGTMFYISVDASASIRDGDLLYKYLDDIVEEIGEENVVQIVTDNASSYVLAGKKLMEKRKSLYWTPCAAHCIDLMLEDIGKMKIFTETIEKAKQVTKFIYRHGWVLSLMRSFTSNHELLRPAVTRFATSYLTLQSLYKQKQALQSMFTSEKWNNSNWVKHVEGMKAKGTILFDPSFWSLVRFCVKATIPIVAVLREVDSDERPSMPYLYEMMDSAKEQILHACGGVKRKYLPIWKKIDERWTPQLHRPLHAAGYYLNPQLRYDDKFSNDQEVRDGLFMCMERMIPNSEERIAADCQLDYFDEAKGDFGSEMAINTRKRRSPADWWARFGTKTPELTRFAIRVLSLTCSASGCERNWSTFEQVHTKRKNRLEQQKLNALVFVMYNMKLRERTMRRKANAEVDPILVEQVDSDDEWITEQENPLLPTDNSWLEDDSMGLDISAIEMIGDTSSKEPEISIVDNTRKRGRETLTQTTQQRESTSSSRRPAQVDVRVRLEEDDEPIPRMQEDEEDFLDDMDEDDFH